MFAKVTLTVAMQVLIKEGYFLRDDFLWEVLFNGNKKTSLHVKANKTLHHLIVKVFLKIFLLMLVVSIKKIRKKGNIILPLISHHL